MSADPSLAPAAELAERLRIPTVDAAFGNEGTRWYVRRNGNFLAAFASKDEALEYANRVPQGIDADDVDEIAAVLERIEDYLKIAREMCTNWRTIYEYPYLDQSLHGIALRVAEIEGEVAKVRATVQANGKAP